MLTNIFEVVSKGRRKNSKRTRGHDASALKALLPNSTATRMNDRESEGDHLEVPNAPLTLMGHASSSPDRLGRESDLDMTRAGGRFIESAHMSNTQKRAYHASASNEEKDVNAALKREFEQVQACTLPRESIDSTSRGEWRRSGALSCGSHGNQ